MRAFALAHVRLLGSLGPREHAWLLELFDGVDDLESPARVA